MSGLESMSKAEPIKNWDAARDDIIAAIDNQIETKFEPVEEITSPLTNVTRKSTEIRKEINCKLFAMEGPPFTIQRLAELALKGREYYSTLPKFLHALEQVVSVTSTFAEFDEKEHLKLLSMPGERDVMLESIEWAE